MTSRGSGAIINVASLAGHMPGSAGHTMYAASKAFLIKFSQSLALENERHGVKVQALCPGFTYSEFHDVTGARQLVAKMPSYMWMGADEVVRLSLAALVVTLVAVLVLLAQKWKRERGLPLLAPLTALFVSVWAWSIFSGIDPLIRYMIPALHSLQYTIRAGVARTPDQWMAAAHAVNAGLAVTGT